MSTVCDCDGCTYISVGYLNFANLILHNIHVPCSKKKTVSRKLLVKKYHFNLDKD